MNVLEEIRSRHRQSDKASQCSCGLPQPCDANIAVAVGLELWDALTLGMGDLNTMRRTINTVVQRNERAIAFAENHDWGKGADIDRRS